MVDPAGTSAEETLFRLALADLPASVVDQWWGTGVAPDMVRVAHREALTVAAARTYLGAGVDSGDALDTHLRLGITPTLAAALYAGGHRTAAAQQRFATEQVAPLHARAYLDFGLTSPAEWVRLTVHGIDPFSADQFRLLGVALPDGAVAEVAATRADPAARAVMDRLNTDVVAVAIYRASGLVTEPDLRMAITGWPVDIAAALAAAGWRTVDEQQDVIDTITLGRFRGYQHNQILDPRDMLRLLTAGVHPNQAGDYRRAGFAHPGDMEGLANAGITPKDVFDFGRRGVTDVETMVAETRRRGRVTSGG